MAQQAEYPFNNYNLYIVHHKAEGRQYACLVPIDPSMGLKRTTLSYARYLMCVKEGRILNPEEQVDHIDNDKSNDDINNLQILTQRENNIKEGKRRGTNMVYLRCPWCGTMFFRERRQTHLVKPANLDFCCREHAAAYYDLKSKNPNHPIIVYGEANNIWMNYVRH